MVIFLTQSLAIVSVRIIASHHIIVGSLDWRPGKGERGRREGKSYTEKGDLPIWFPDFKLNLNYKVVALKPTTEWYHMAQLFF